MSLDSLLTNKLLHLEFSADNEGTYISMLFGSIRALINNLIVIL